MFSTRDLGLGATIDVNSVPLSQKYIIAVILGTAIWNSIEVLPIIYFTFTRYSGLYFWSVLAADLGVLVSAVGFILNNFQLTGNQTLPTILTCMAWIPMVSGQSLVLYSRLHLINLNDTIRRLLLTMIILDGIALHTGTLVTTIGANGKAAKIFLGPYAVMERIQVTTFFIQELILSGAYLWKARCFLTMRGSRDRDRGSKAQRNLRSMMVHLILSNVIVVALDITIVVLELMGLYFVQVSYKAFVYSVKLKCEIGILNRLADFVKAATALKHTPDNPFQDFQGSFQLSSQIEREWETTLRNTFGVTVEEEERKNADTDNDTRMLVRRPSMGEKRSSGGQVTDAPALRMFGPEGAGRSRNSIHLFEGLTSMSSGSDVATLGSREPSPPLEKPRRSMLRPQALHLGGSLKDT